MIRIGMAAMLVVLTTTGCASTNPPVADTSDLEALYWERQEAAIQSYTPADVSFMTGMIAHHAQALVMSRMAPERSASGQVKTLAARIINAQNDEIATMQRWLRDRGQPVPEIHIDGNHLMVHGAGDHSMSMPGMLSKEQIDDLAASSGNEFDRLFLTYMIQHHEGATTMVKELFGTDGAGQDEASFRLASDINVDQITEIARMKRMLESLTSSTQGR
ncbi:MAG: DUF305 domain-containing protein [Rhodothermales bacterium]|nr:DUF305 domain-containing protein [Rhodothermales bacterium]